jgi:hypothetical protein
MISGLTINFIYTAKALVTFRRFLRKIKPIGFDKDGLFYRNKIAVFNAAVVKNG